MNKKSPKQNWKYIAVLALFSGVIFIAILYLLDSLSGVKSKPWYVLIVEGIIFAVIYGLLFYLMTEKLIPALTKSIKPKLIDHEKKGSDSPASLLRGFEKVGGKLFLTNKRLIFKPHKLNIHRKQINFELEQISEVVKRKISNAPDNGIRITTADGKSHDFVVQDRDLWLEKLNEKRGK